MSKLQNWLISKTVRDEEGQGLAEYGLILALVAVVCAAALTSLQGGIDGVFADVVAAF